MEQKQLKVAQLRQQANYIQVSLSDLWSVIKLNSSMSITKNYPLDWDLKSFWVT